MPRHLPLLGLLSPGTPVPSTPGPSCLHLAHVQCTGRLVVCASIKAPPATRSRGHRLQTLALFCHRPGRSLHEPPPGGKAGGVLWPGLGGASSRGFGPPLRPLLPRPSLPCRRLLILQTPAGARLLPSGPLPQPPSALTGPQRGDASCFGLRTPLSGLQFRSIRG